MQIVAREDLYDQVWKRALGKVAADYGITGTALKKICDRYEIPTPERGYWAKLQFGKPVAHPSLPAVSDPRLARVQIAGSGLAALPQAVSDAKSRVRDRLAEAVATDTASAGVYKTPEEAASAIPSLVATLRALRKARPDHQGFVVAKGRGVVPVRVGPQSVDRSILLLAQFLAVAGSQGFAPTVTDDALTLVVEGEAIGFGLEAQPDRTPHLPTASELKEQARYASWGSSREPWPKYDHFPSDKLSILIQANQYSGLRKTFSDRQRTPLEQALGTVLEAFAEHAAFARNRREEQEASARRYKEAERLRKLDEAFASREKRRIEFAEAVHERIVERGRLSDVLRHLTSRKGDDLATREMTNWLGRRIAQLDAVLSPEFLTLSAQASKLSFSEAPPAGEVSEYYYYPPISLHYWSVNEADGSSRSQTPLQWLKASGLLTANAGHD